MKGFWPIVRILLHYARVRSKGRAAHQRKLMNHRAARNAAFDFSGCAVVIGILFMGIVHGVFGGLFSILPSQALQVVAARQNLIVLSHQTMKQVAAHVDEYFRTQSVEEAWEKAVERWEKAKPAPDVNLADERKKAAEGLRKTKEYRESELKTLNADLEYEARHQAFSKRSASKSDAEKKRYVAHYAKFGIRGFTTEKKLRDDWRIFKNEPPIFSLLTTLVLLWWFIMQAFQGEGMELDFQRRRHPMWEWLLSHPVNPKAVFAAEMLAPVAANPMFVMAPLFWIVVFSLRYDVPTGILSGLAVGIPMALAASFFSKALEIAVMIRLSPRSRGGVLGIMSWLGYASLFAAFILLNSPNLVAALVRGLDYVAEFLPFHMRIGDWMLGLGWGAAAAWKGVLVSLGVSFLVAAACIWFCAWATNKGIAGGFGSVAAAPVALNAETSRQWLRDPLYRKELLWFWRDKSAVVQVFLVPMTMAGYQAFNLRGVAELMSYSWHAISGLAVIFGTYFLFIIGPRSLISEGAALWIPLSWPRGIEGLLKAKARLWWMLSSAIVSLGLLVGALVFPADAWKIAIIAVGWFLFSGSLAEKTVTLVSPPSSSGEPEPIPAGRRMAASLGTFTFAVGVLSQQWSLAFAGVVYSWLTSAAMWQNFRARLPFLFDPWSEKLPPAPTLMHAMIAISAMVEVMSIPLALTIALAGQEHLMLARALCYGAIGSLTAFFMDSWLAGRKVARRDITHWGERYPGEAPSPHLAPWQPGMSAAKTALYTIGGGLCLGLLGLVYSWLVLQFPELAKDFHQSMEQVAKHPNERWWLFTMGVAFAPLAEEYLFRGLLYRALDREWGGWRAIVASGAFFAIYHPPMAWLPVAAVGIYNAWLFKRSRFLIPCVIVHSIYNAIVFCAL